MEEKEKQRRRESGRKKSRIKIQYNTNAGKKGVRLNKTLMSPPPAHL